MTFKFSPEDFISLPSPGKVQAAEIANKLFQKWLSEQPVVYGQKPHAEHVWNTKNPEWYDTHTARLIDIREIGKKECEHPRAELITFPSKPEAARCGKCGQNFKAKWEPA